MDLLVKVEFVLQSSGGVTSVVVTIPHGTAFALTPVSRLNGISVSQLGHSPRALNPDGSPRLDLVTLIIRGAVAPGAVVAGAEALLTDVTDEKEGPAYVGVDPK